MALVHISALQGNINLTLNSTVPLIEDPNPAANRLFLTGTGYDTTYLNPIFGTNFHYNSPSPTYAFNGYPFSSSAQNNSLGGIIATHKASINCSAGANNTNNADRDAYSAFHRSLDPANYPAKKMWYTVNNRVVMAGTYVDQGDQNGTDSSQWYQIYPSDITQGYLYQGLAGTTFPSVFFYEDQLNNILWGMSTAAALFPGIHYTRNYDQPASVSNNRILRNDYLTPHFLGVDVANNTYWVGQDYLAGDPYFIYRYSAGNNSQTPVLSSIIGTTNNASRSSGGISQGATVIYNSRPSNVRYDNSSTRVFYSAHFDGVGEFKPYRFQWDPTNTSGVSNTNTGTAFTATTCTMVYAVGTCSNYMRPIQTPGYGTYNADNWHYQGWQFRPANTTTWYLTFWPSDKTTPSVTQSSGFNSSAARWSTPLSRTMMTYSINTATDSFTTATLTYHSSYTFPSVPEIPRDWLPTTSDGTQMAVPVSGKVNFFTFNASQGWGLTNTYPFEMQTMGLDMQNRLWGIGNEVGNYTVHLITPTNPYTVSVIMPTQNFTYTGTNILTTATMVAYDASGIQVGITTNLSINGNSMLFTDNGLTTLTTTTNATTATAINLTIFGGGVNNIVVGATI
jgi:hypothetical protein